MDTEQGRRTLDAERARQTQMATLSGGLHEYLLEMGVRAHVRSERGGMESSTCGG